jgi:hypothetical protein
MHMHILKSVYMLTHNPQMAVVKKAPVKEVTATPVAKKPAARKPAT